MRSKTIVFPFNFLRRARIQSHPPSRPPPHPHPTPHRLPQEPFPRLQRPLHPQLKLIMPPHRCHNKRQLHFRHVPSDTSSGPVAKWDECCFLLIGQLAVFPALGPEAVGVGAPDGLGVVNGVGGDGEGGIGGKVMAEDGDAGARRDKAGETEGGGAVDAEGFGDYVLEAG